VGIPSLARMAWALPVAVALSTASLVGPVAAKSQGPGQQGTEYVDVVPSDHLKGRTTVKVSGRGFPGGASLAVTECLIAAVGVDDCDLSTVQLGVTARGDGSFGSVRFVVRPVIRVGGRSGPVTCGKTGCSVGVGTLDGVYGGSHCIGFGGPCRPPPAPSPTVGAPPSAPASSRPPSSQTHAPTAAASGSGGGSNAGLIAGLIAAGVVVALLVGIGMARRRSNS
jgi:Neocarzinostatin family